jgi:GntR family transcriptional regulator
VRRYYAEAGQLLEVSDNVHPSDRFSYRMQLQR